jgi:hypothetical protein
MLVLKFEAVLLKREAVLTLSDVTVVYVCKYLPLF